MLSDALAWRRVLAGRVAAAYAADPNAVAVLIAGSVGRGCADRWSDIEIDVYYHRPPTRAEREAAVARAGARLLELDADDEEWAELMSIGGCDVATSTFLVATLEGYIRQVVEHGAIAPLAQVRLAALFSAQPVKGQALIAAWRAQAAYPDALSEAMLRAGLDFGRFWRSAAMLAERDDRLALMQVLVETGQRLVWVLFGLNRCYLPTPDGLKWLDLSLAAMPLQPRDCAARLRQTLAAPPTAAVREMAALIDELLALIAAHRPDFDLQPYRRAAAWQRRPCDALPEQIADASV